MAVVLLTGSFAGTGTSSAVKIWGDFNVTLGGSFTATISVERSLDSGNSWTVVAADGKGTPATYTSPIALVGQEIENGAQYRLNCTSFAAGPVNYRISQGEWRLRF